MDAQVERVDGSEVGAGIDLGQVDRANDLAAIEVLGGERAVVRSHRQSVDWLGLGHRPNVQRTRRPARARLPSRRMADTHKIAKNLERFAQAVASHDRENPTHTAHGIGLAHFDMERLGFDEGEEILPGITIHADSGVTGNFRVLCDGEHDEGLVESEQEAVEAVATQSVPVSSPRALSIRRAVAHFEER